ncbi:MAG: SDR family oxidoreductase [Pseudomonadota bacterium]
MTDLSQFSLSGKSFVITGASSGIGAAVSGFLADAGAQVLLLARRQERLDIAVESINNSEHRRAHALAADLSDRETIPEVAASCTEILGQVDGVVNAAGVNLRQPEDDISLESWDQTLNLNLAVPFFFSREFVNGMRERRFGRIINIASLQSSRAFENGLAYGASKGGICQLTRAMAQAWSRYGITANAIAPGFFPTELTAPVFSDPDREEAIAAQTAIGRNGKLEDLCGPMIFFASSASSYITGQTLYIDGGFTAK